MYKHLIFDCFGTLIDTGTGSIDAVKSILQRVGYETDPKAFYKEWKAIKKEMMSSGIFNSEKKLFKMSLAELFERYGIVADASVEVKPMIDTLFASRVVFPDTIETLAQLEKIGIDYVIGSTTDTDSLIHFLKQNNLNEVRFFTSEDMEVYKPATQFYNTILERTGWNVAECLFVGDNLVDDILGPQKIGMRTALISRNDCGTKESAIVPNYVIHTLMELIEIVKKTEA